MKDMATPSRPRLQRGWHCVYDMHYHFVFVVKYRRALLTPEVVTELTRISLEIQERHEFEIEMLGADKNHVHLLCAAHPKVAAGDIARIYKSISARELFKALPALRQQLWGCVSNSGAVPSGPAAISARRSASSAATRASSAMLRSRGRRRRT